jgi:cysteine desulfurase
VDLLSLSGSKIEQGGRAGVLFVKDLNNISPVFFGGNQEMGLRPGTENVGDISKFANAFTFSQKIKEKELIIQKLKIYIKKNMPPQKLNQSQSTQKNKSSGSKTVSSKKK